MARDNEPTLAELASATKSFISDVKSHISRTDEKTREMADRHAELQAIVTELAQKEARSRHAYSEPLGATAYQDAVGTSVEAIVAGLADATSMRTTMRLSPKAISAATLSGTTYDVPSESLGPVSTYHAPVARLIELLPPRPVSGNSVTYVRVKYSADSPGGNAAAIVAELATKPESSVATTPVTASVLTFAHWIDTSKQILDDVTELRSILDGILRGGLLDVIDSHIYSTLTTVGNFMSFTPTSGEAIGDSVARIAAQVANEGGKNVIVALNVMDFLSMQLTKADSSGVYLGIPPNLASRVVGVPTVATGKVLAFAPGSGAQWGDREGVTVVSGLKDDDFIRNAITLLCEARGLAIVRDPEHIAFGDVVSA